MIEHPEEFNLSDKEVYAPEVKTLGRTYEESLVIPKKDVKEFIKLIKDKCKLHVLAQDIIIYLDKLAGDKLTK